VNSWRRRWTTWLRFCASSRKRCSVIARTLTRPAFATSLTYISRTLAEQTVRYSHHFSHRSRPLPLTSNSVPFGNISVDQPKGLLFHLDLGAGSNKKRWQTLRPIHYLSILERIYASPDIVISMTLGQFMTLTFVTLTLTSQCSDIVFPRSLTLDVVFTACK